MGSLKVVEEHGRMKNFSGRNKFIENKNLKLKYWYRNSLPAKKDIYDDDLQERWYFCENHVTEINEITRRAISQTNI